MNIDHVQKGVTEKVLPDTASTMWELVCWGGAMFCGTTPSAWESRR
jgi:hypothetical protein